MSDGLARFNALPESEAAHGLKSCFAHERWASKVARGRPYADADALLAAAEAGWAELEPSDWQAVIASHPRIGEGGGHAQTASDREQSGVRDAPPEMMAALAAGNRDYEDRFGHIFLIAAAGKNADQILEALRRRMKNDPATEAELASQELRKIGRMRIQSMVAR